MALTDGPDGWPWWMALGGRPWWMALADGPTDGPGGRPDGWPLAKGRGRMASIGTAFESAGHGSAAVWRELYVRDFAVKRAPSSAIHAIRSIGTDLLHRCRCLCRHHHHHYRQHHHHVIITISIATITTTTTTTTAAAAAAAAATYSRWTRMGCVLKCSCYVLHGVSTSRTPGRQEYPCSAA